MSPDVIPGGYGQDAAERIRQAGFRGGNFDAFIDTFGDGYVEQAAELSVRPERIGTIGGRRATARVGARAYG
ncbi:hypothetical protein ACIQWL_51440 [Streptomyces mirabilis]|uniref:hypothetical protein n=1 Tax=Streptomyces mirabilis TaxID=68239 RepID=UPI0033FC1C09